VALLICDVWDRHWCVSATGRAAALAVRIDDAARRARASGCLVIHAPADATACYEHWPQRESARRPPSRMPPPRDLDEPPAAPFDPSGPCGDDPPCVEPDGPPWPWRSQHPSIWIGPEDVITDEGAEVYATLADRQIRLLLYSGIHTNQCVLDRPFGIRAMVGAGVECALVRDLTEAWCSPAVMGVDRASELTVQYIERHLCASIGSEDLR
jgi:hypothetical protein